MNLLKKVLSLKNKSILVVGDTMVDRFIWGKVSRISPEAPVPVVEVKNETETYITTLKDKNDAINEMEGNCGIWYSKGIYYVDHSFRVKTKKEALRIGKEFQQISVLKWSNMSLVYC